MTDTLISNKPPRLEAKNIPMDQISAEGTGLKPGDDLVASVKEFGILEPLILTPIFTGDGARGYLILAGRRRYRAAEINGLKSVPARVITESTSLTDNAIALIENAHRRPNESVAFEALKSLMQTGLTLGEIQKQLHLDENSLKRLMRLTKLVPALQRAFAQGKISSVTAYGMTKLPEDKQIALGVKLYVDGKITSGDIKKIRLAQRDEAGADLQDLFTEGGEIAFDWKAAVYQRLNEAHSLCPIGDEDAGYIQANIEHLVENYLREYIEESDAVESD